MFQQAAAQGHAEGHYNMGVMELNGQGAGGPAHANPDAAARHFQVG